MFAALTSLLMAALLFWFHKGHIWPIPVQIHARTMTMVAIIAAMAAVISFLGKSCNRNSCLLSGTVLSLSVVPVLCPFLTARLEWPPCPWLNWLAGVLGGLLAACLAWLLIRAYEWLHLWFFEVSRTTRAKAHPAESRQAPVSLTPYAWLSIAAAIATMAMKLAAFMLTNSVALLSDAAESLVNLAGAVFALLILRQAARPADRTHHFGHGEAEYFSSGFEGALILVAAFAIASAAWQRFWQPSEVLALDYGMLISMAATLVNLLVARVLLKAGNQYGSITLEADGKHLMTDVWTTGAVLVALAGMTVTGWQWLDPVIAGLAALNILSTGVHLIIRSASGLMGASIPETELEGLQRVLENYRQKGYVFHELRTRASGSQRLITLHVLVPGAMTVAEGHKLLEELESDIGKVIPNLIIVTHLEPLEDRLAYNHVPAAPDLP